MCRVWGLYVCSRPFGGCILAIPVWYFQTSPHGSWLAFPPAPCPPPGEGAGSWVVQDSVMNRGTAWHGGVCALVAIRCPACCCGLGAPGLGLAESVLTVDQNVLWESREPRTPCVKSSTWEFRPGIRDGYFCAQRPFFFASCFRRVEVSNL